jgi:hypothetical protein
VIYMTINCIFYVSCETHCGDLLRKIFMYVGQMDVRQVIKSSFGYFRSREGGGFGLTNSKTERSNTSQIMVDSW